MFSAINIQISPMVSVAKKTFMESEVAQPPLLCPQGFIQTTYNTSLLFDNTFTMNGCVEACRRPIFTPHQYAEADGLSRISSYLGFAAIIFLRFAWQLKRDQPKRQYCISQFITISLIGSVGFMLSSTASDINTVLCRSDIRPRVQRDGLSLCIIQSAFMIFTPLALSLAWLAQLIDLYLKLVKGHKTTEPYRYYYMALIYPYPILAVVIYGVCGMFGYNGWNQYCTQRELPPFLFNVSLLVFFLPAILIQLAGVAILGLLVVKIGNTWYHMLTSHPLAAPPHLSVSHHKHGSVRPLPFPASNAFPVAVGVGADLNNRQSISRNNDISSSNNSHSIRNGTGTRSFINVVAIYRPYSLLSLLSVRSRTRRSKPTSPQPILEDIGATGVVEKQKCDDGRGRERGSVFSGGSGGVNGRRGSVVGLEGVMISPSGSTAEHVRTPTTSMPLQRRASSAQQQQQHSQLQSPAQRLLLLQSSSSPLSSSEQRAAGAVAVTGTAAVAGIGLGSRANSITPAPNDLNAAAADRTEQEKKEAKVPKQLLMKSLVGSTGLIVFCVLFLFCWCCFFSIKLQDVMQSKHAAANLTSWLECVKAHFDGVSDGSWISVCGGQPVHYAGKHRMHLVATFLTNGQSLVVSAVLASQFLNICHQKKITADREIARMLEIRRSRALRRRQTIAL